jgi:hypothetical protein
LIHEKQIYRMENEIMQTTNLIAETPFRPRVNWVAVLSALASLVVGSSQLSLAQSSGPENFSSPWKAINALFEAVGDSDEEGVERILGAGKEVTSSSDEIKDKLDRERFSEKYQEMHRLVREPDGSTVLYIGAENWPFPVPLVSNNGAWHFDSDTGMQEILFRTIGENETTAIQVCHGLSKVKQRSKTEIGGADPISQYAQSLVRDATANADNGERGMGIPSSPFHGYYFRRVPGTTSAGTSDRNPGSGKADTVALVAYPADYRSSGVMTFMVTKNGIVYQKDLGSKTPTVAKNLGRGPDLSWHATQ